MKYCPALLPILLLIGCGGGQQWPADTGYLNEPENRPSKPHDVEAADGTVTIKEDMGGGMLSVEGKVRMRNGRMTVAFPGTTIVQASSSKDSITLEDFNGDKCVVPFGMTVKVDSYGQFTPLDYSPDMTVDDDQ